MLLVQMVTKKKILYCWVLMLLLFVGGVMNLLWIAAMAFFVLLGRGRDEAGSGA